MKEGQTSLKWLVRMMSYVLVFETVCALVTQLCHVFTRPVLISIHIIVLCAVVGYALWRRDLWVDQMQNISKSINVRDIWMPTTALVIVCFELWSVHYKYNGIISTVTGLDVVQESSYPYPLYSDEWVGVSFFEYSIRTHSLPLANPLYHDQSFANPLVGFYSLIASVCLLFGLAPLTGFAVLAIVLGVFISWLVYALIRLYGGSIYAASLGSLAVPLITVSTNVPGVWYLVPFLGGFALYVLALCVSTLDRPRFAHVLYVLACVLYPPMIVFVIPTVLVQYSRRSVMYVLWAIFLVSILCVLGSYFRPEWLPEYLNTLLSWIIRPNIEGGHLVILPWVLMPIPLLAISIIGVADAVHRKLYTVIAPLCTGVAFWMIYAFDQNTFIIDYSRVAAITALLLVICFGCGVDWIYRKMRQVGMRVGKSSILFAKDLLLLRLVVFVGFVIIAWAYPMGNAWSEFVLVHEDKDGVSILSPVAPVNQYLTADDLRLFQGIHEKHFISIPWKGLVIGVATHNYPLESKTSTIFNRIVKYKKFMSLSCADKSRVAKKYDISYAYTEAFVCPSFQEIGVSGENFHLYQFQD